MEEHADLRITDRLIHISYHLIGLDKNPAALAGQPVGTQHILHRIQDLLGSSSLQVHDRFENSRVITDADILAILYNVRAQFHRLVQDPHLALWIFGKCIMVQPQNTDLQEEGIAGVILLNQFPACIHYLFKGFFRKFRRQVMIDLLDLFFPQLRLISQ